MENGISIILPSYNEAENLKLLLPGINNVIKKMSCPYELLVIDTLSSTDNTREVCEINSAAYIPRVGGNTYGDAIRTGIDAAKYSKIVIMDSDGSHNPDDIPRLYEKFEQGFDVVIGSRYVSGGKTDNNWLLKLMSLCVNLVFIIIFNL